MKPLATCIASVLLALAVLHAVWAARGSSTSVALPSRADGTPLFRPGPVATLLVAAALTLAGALVIARAWISPDAAAARWVSRATWALAAVFALRTVGEFRYVGLFKRERRTHFARWDTLLFTPLCAALALAIGVLAAN